MDGRVSAVPRRGSPRAADTSSHSAPRASPSRLAMLERRAAAARRRLTLTVVLLLGTVTAWVVVGLGVAPWWAGAVPTALLALVLVLGRSAVLAAKRADAAWLAERRAEARASRGTVAGAPPAPRAARPRVTGHAVHASQLSTQMIPRVVAPEGARASSAPAASPDATSGVMSGETAATDDGPHGQTEAAAAATAGASPVTAEPTQDGADGPDGRAAGSAGAEGADAERSDDARDDDRVPSGRAWDPVPVPRPTYTMKPTAPRREPAPLPQAEPSPSAGVAAAVVATPAPERAEGDVQKPKTETLGLDLNEILARRRAAGQ